MLKGNNGNADVDEEVKTLTKRSLRKHRKRSQRQRPVAVVQMKRAKKHVLAIQKKQVKTVAQMLNLLIRL